MPQNLFAQYDIDTGEKSGTFAVVYPAVRKSDKLPVAIKIIDQDRNTNHPKIDREINVLRRCQHPNIIRYIDYMVEGSVYAIVMEQGGQNLASYRSKKDYSMLQYQRIMSQLVSACQVTWLLNQYLYRNDIMHRDLKLENVVRVGDSWKLVDFGFAIQGNIDDPAARSKLGNKFGRAPEILQGKEYNHKADIWSLGVLCYKLVYNKFPFENGGIGDIDRMRQNPFIGGLVPHSFREKCIQDFISHCLIYNKDHRIGWADIMRHPLMNKTSLDDVLENELHCTLSGHIIDPDKEILQEMFSNVATMSKQQEAVLIKLLMIRKKVVVLESILFDFVDCWLKKFLKDGKDTKYEKRECLVPLLGHLISQIKKIQCLIVDKKKSSCYVNGIFRQEDIEVIESMKLEPNSLKYFQKVEERLVARFVRLCNEESREVKDLSPPEFKNTLINIKSTFDKVGDKLGSNPKHHDDYRMMGVLLADLQQESRGILLDDISNHAQLEGFVRRYLFKTVIFEARK